MFTLLAVGLILVAYFGKEKMPDMASKILFGAGAFVFTLIMGFGMFTLIVLGLMTAAFLGKEKIPSQVNNAMLAIGAVLVSIMSFGLTAILILSVMAFGFMKFKK